jgi:hypothetical protein
MTESAGCQWLMCAIVPTQEAEVRRIMAWSQLRQIVCETLSWKILSQRGFGGVAQDVGPKFKPQYHKKERKKKKQWKSLFAKFHREGENYTCEEKQTCLHRHMLSVLEWWSGSSDEFIMEIYRFVRQMPVPQTPKPRDCQVHYIKFAYNLYWCSGVL